MEEKLLIHAILLQARAIGHMSMCKRRDAMDCLECMEMIGAAYNTVSAALGKKNLFQAFKDLGYKEIE